MGPRYGSWNSVKRQCLDNARWHHHNLNNSLYPLYCMLNPHWDRFCIMQPWASADKPYESVQCPLGALTRLLKMRGQQWRGALKSFRWGWLERLSTGTCVKCKFIWGFKWLGKGFWLGPKPLCPRPLCLCSCYPPWCFMESQNYDELKHHISM